MLNCTVFIAYLVLILCIKPFDRNRLWARNFRVATLTIACLGQTFCGSVALIPLYLSNLKSTHLRLHLSPPMCCAGCSSNFIRAVYVCTNQECMGDANNYRRKCSETQVNKLPYKAKDSFRMSDNPMLHDTKMGAVKSHVSGASTVDSKSRSMSNDSFGDNPMLHDTKMGAVKIRCLHSCSEEQIHPAIKPYK